jgi:hypothetical protein
MLLVENKMHVEAGNTRNIYMVSYLFVRANDFLLDDYFNDTLVYMWPNLSKYSDIFDWWRLNVDDLVSNQL